MKTERAIEILGESVAGKTTHNQEFRTACQMGCAALNDQLRKEADHAESKDAAANDRHR